MGDLGDGTNAVAGGESCLDGLGPRPFGPVEPGLGFAHQLGAVVQSGHDRDRCHQLGHFLSLAPNSGPAAALVENLYLLG